jgi:hypothetical protein
MVLRHPGYQELKFDYYQILLINEIKKIFLLYLQIIYFLAICLKVKLK